MDIIVLSFTFDQLCNVISYVQTFTKKKKKRKDKEKHKTKKI